VEQSGLLIIFGIVAVVMARRAATNCRATIERWAAANGFRLISATREWMSVSWLLRSKTQRVYGVEVVDVNGRHRWAALLVGNYFFGSTLDQVKVKWRD
jgi:hypothetical protein